VLDREREARGLVEADGVGGAGAGGERARETLRQVDVGRHRRRARRGVGISRDRRIHGGGIVVVGAAREESEDEEE